MSLWRKWLHKSEFPLIFYDGVPWEFPLPRKIVAIGDVQGDLKALAAICRESGLLDEEGAWIGKDAHLVLVGDVVTEGGSPLLVDFIMRLELEAKRSGGNVHALLGNHDLKDSDRDPSRIAWSCSRNAIIRLGKFLFVHAGLDRTSLNTEPGRLNATIRAWIRHDRKAGPRPPAGTIWVTGDGEEIGPLWTRAFKVKLGKKEKYRHRPGTEPLSAKDLRTALEAWGAEKLVVGHAPLENGEILLEHPEYGDSVIMTDTRISEDEGNLSALVIEGGAPRAVSFSSAKKGKAIVRLQKEYSKSRKRSWWTRLFHRS